MSIKRSRPAIRRSQSLTDHRDCQMPNALLEARAFSSKSAPGTPQCMRKPRCRIAFVHYN